MGPRSLSRMIAALEWHVTEPGLAMGQFGSGYWREQTCSQVVNRVIILYKVFCFICVEEIRSHIVLSFSRKQLKILF